MNVQLFASFLLYFAFILLIGWYFHKRQTSEGEFIMGNRSLNFWLTAFSAHASDMSAWLFMAFPAAIYLGGLTHAWAAFGLVIGMFLNWQLVAKNLRIQTEKYNSYTLPTYFENRFQDGSGAIRIVTAVMTVIFLACYLTAGLIAMGFLFESIFGLDYYLGLSIATIVAVTYMFFGGYVTVAWVDLFQALFLLAMIIIVPLVGYLSIPGGLSSIEKIIAEKGLDTDLFDNLHLKLLLSFGWGLGYFGQPHILTKFMGIKDPSKMYKSKYVGMSWQIVALGAAIAVGYVGIGLFPTVIANPELIFVEIVKSEFLPFFGGIILCGILAANISTMDSQILVCASVISEDFYKHFVHKKASAQNLLLVSRISVVVVALISLLIAFYQSATILETVFYAWSGLGCSFGPLVFMALYSKTANKYGAFAGIVVGGLVAGIWPMLNPYFTNVIIPAMVPGFILSFLSIYFVSLLTRETVR